MKNTPEIREFIKEHKHLFWYISEEKKEEISRELLVETILNYGTLEDFKQLVSLLGINTVHNLFKSSVEKSERRKGNYHELTLNFFSLVFKRYAS